jgi:NADH:ubiquinone oxidoreductase subunit E
MEVIVCIGSSCHLRGSRDVVQILERNIALNGLRDQITLKGSFCMGECREGVCVSVDGQRFSVTPGETEAFFNREILGRISI